MANKWTSNEINELNDLMNRGLTAKQIAKLLDRTVFSVQLKMTRTERVAVDIISVSELSTQLSIYRNNLNLYLRRAGIAPYITRNNQLYFKIEDIQAWLDSGFALSIVINHAPRDNMAWDMIRVSLSRIDKLTTRNVICTAFSVTNSNIGYWIESMGFPKPISRVHNIGQIFIRKDVEEWAINNNKSHGKLSITVGDFISSTSHDGV